MKHESNERRLSTSKTFWKGLFPPKFVLSFLSLFFLLNLSAVYAQQGNSVSGTVTDPSGTPMPGVTVVVKGTTIGTITNSEGEYSLSDVPDDAVLTFSFVGMITQEVDVENQTSINATMQEDTIGIEEVVAVGYASQRKVDLTGSVAVADVEKLQDSPSPNIIKSLQGQIPGLYITTDGKPSGGATVRVRGMSTLNNNDPLYIIDGVPTKSSAFRILNPNDIQSIQVLKDASSSAIYGSRASNGVIIVETKSASQEKIEVNYGVSLTHSYYGSKPELLDAEGRAIVAWRATIYDGGNPDNIPHVNYDWYRDESGKAILKGVSFPEYIVPGLRTANTNWYDAMSRNGFIQEHNLSISSGTKTSGTRMSLRYYDDQYLHKFTDAKNYSFRINSFQKLFNNILEVGQNLTIANNVQN